MRWPVFAIFAYLMLTLEQSLRTLWASNYTCPSFLLILMVFISSWAPAMTAVWAALILGLLVDLSSPVLPANHAHDVVLIGPAALGYLTGAYVTILLRGMFFRDSPLAIGVLVLIAGAFTHLVVVALLTVRGLPWLIAEPLRGWSAADELVASFFELLYSAALAVPLGYCLVRLRWVWGFHLHPGKGAGHHYSWR